MRIDKLNSFGIGLFEVTGGEPFLRRDLNQILTRIAQLKLHFYVVTNGEYLETIDDNLIATLKKSLGVAVSIDGVGEVHNKVRQRQGLYDKLISGLDIVYANGIQIYLIATLNRENICSVPDMISVAKRYDTTIHFRPTIRTGGAIINNLEHVDLAIELGKYLHHPNVRNGLLSTKKIIPEAKYYGCGIRKRISVSSSGILFPCVMDRSRSSIKIESYSQQTLVNELIAETKSFLNNHELCKSCKVNDKRSEPVCGGFCRFSRSYIKEIKV